ncbi:MAG: 4-(cytidine 5'-diphospho)-2-C-methyl-D-erythritol kinase [Planctomycetota bacterium]
MNTPMIPVLEETKDSITVTSPAKINLWLEILRRRDDGFHELVSLMAPTTLVDHISVKFGVEEDLLEVPNGGAPEDGSNLVLKALHLARQSRPIPPVHFELYKRIPAQAGLGGGSGNAAAILKCLHRKFPDPRGWTGVIADAEALGSDISFFLGDGPAVVRGRGEILEPMQEPLFTGLSPYACIWYPGFGLSTAEVYQQLGGPLTSGHMCRNFDIKNFRHGQEGFQHLFNRLLDGAKRLDPRIAQISDLLEDRFSGRWIMTGSGSGFVIFATGPEASEADATLLRGLIASRFRAEDDSSVSGIQGDEIHVVSLLTGS